MTTRSDNATLQRQKLHRTQTLCSLFRIQRKDGFVLRFTDHDRILGFDGESYQPLGLGSVSAERREAGLRSGNQEATGVIDGTDIVIPDLLGNRYRGATVRQRIVDWRMPWLVNYSATKIVRQVKWDGSRWVATLEGVAAKLQRPVGGRFGGTFTTTCTNTLADPDTCRADISFQLREDVVVQTIIDERMVVRFDSATWPGAFADDSYRDGECEWTVGDNAGTVSPIARHVHSTREVTLLIPTSFPIQVGDEATLRPGCDGLKTTCQTRFRTIIESGTSTGGNTSTTLNDTGKTWATNEHVGRLCFVPGGSGQERTITGNTPTALTITPAWSPTPGAEAYSIRVSNILNFSGSPYDPGAGKVLEQTG